MVLVTGNPCIAESSDIYRPEPGVISIELRKEIVREKFANNMPK
jgi:hypothetical protein